MRSPLFPVASVKISSEPVTSDNFISRVDFSFVYRFRGPSVYIFYTIGKTPFLHLHPRSYKTPSRRLIDIQLVFP